MSVVQTYEDKLQRIIEANIGHFMTKLLRHFHSEDAGILPLIVETALVRTLAKELAVHYEGRKIDVERLDTICADLWLHTQEYHSGGKAKPKLRLVKPGESR